MNLAEYKAKQAAEQAEIARIEGILAEAAAQGMAAVEDAAGNVAYVHPDCVAAHVEAGWTQVQ